MERISNWFSNFLPFDFPLVYQDIQFKTNENFYQAMKMPKDRVDLRKQIAYMLPAQAKRAIRDKEKYPWRKDWDDTLKLEVMEYGLRWKFAPDTLYWYPMLVATDEDEIVEFNNWHDNFWGDCLCEKCKKIKGHNNLGKLLMKIRKEFTDDGRC